MYIYRCCSTHTVSFQAPTFFILFTLRDRGLSSQVTPPTRYSAAETDTKLVFFTMTSKSPWTFTSLTYPTNSSTRYKSTFGWAFSKALNRVRRIGLIRPMGGILESVKDTLQVMLDYQTADGSLPEAGLKHSTQ
jgi:hypothetical protein